MKFNKRQEKKCIYIPIEAKFFIQYIIARKKLPISTTCKASRLECCGYGVEECCISTAKLSGAIFRHLNNVLLPTSVLDLPSLSPSGKNT